MIDERKQLNFVHIPKTGGSYIEMYIASHIYQDFDIGRWKAYVERKLLNPKNWQEYISCLPNLEQLPATNPYQNPYHVPAKFVPTNYRHSFCVIREPLDLRISAYNHLCVYHNYTKSFNAYLQSHDFMNLPKDRGRLPSSFGLRQFDYICDDRGNILLSKIFYYDEFEKCLDYVDHIYDQERPRFDRFNSNFFWNKKYNSSTEKPQQTLNRDTVSIEDKSTEILNRYFKKDFELWSRKR